MHGRGLLVLLVLAAAVTAGLYFTRASASGEGDTLQESVLGARSVSDAVQISIRSQPDVSPIEIAQEAGGQFAMREPVRDALSQGWLQAFADSWNSAMIVRAFAPEAVDAELLRQHGLEKPRGEVTFTFADAVLRFEIGDVGPLGHLFLRHDGVIYRGAADLYSSIQGTPDDLREHVIFRHRPDQVRRLQMRRRLANGEYESLVVERREGDYRLIAPIEAPAADAAVRVLLAQMLGLRLDRFTPGNVREPDASADFIVDVEGERGAERLSLWRRENDSLFGVHRERDVGLVLDGRTAQGLFTVTGESLRSRVLIPFVIDDMRQLKLDPGAGRGASIVLTRDATGGFRLQQPVDAPANPSTVIKLAQALRRLGAIEFVTSAPGDDVSRHGVGSGSMSLEILGPLQTKPTELRFGDDVAPAGGGTPELTYCYAPQDSLVVKVPKEVVDALRQPWHEFVALQVYRNERPIDVGRLVYRGAESATFTRGADGKFRRQGEAVALDKIGEVVARLCDLKASRAVAEEEVPREGRVDLLLQRDTGDELRSITLVEANDRLYGRQSRLEVWFELPSLDRVLLEAFR